MIAKLSKGAGINDDKSVSEIDVAQVYPETETHNLLNPQTCWCMPETEAYFDEDGQVDLVTVEHRWIQ